MSLHPALQRTVLGGKWLLLLEELLVRTKERGGGLQSVNKISKCAYVQSRFSL